MKTISEKKEKIYNVLKSEMSEPLKVLEIESIILSEMTALMKECVGEIKDCTICDNGRAYCDCSGYNLKIEELKTIAAKHGLKI